MPRTRLVVGMPVFNGERFIAGHIQAFLDQTFEDFELLIGDNASTDRTQEICLDFAAKDPRVRYVRREKNLGAAANANLLIEACEAEYFKFAAFDDMHAPEHLERCVAALDEDPSVVLACTGVQLIDDRGAQVPWDEERGRFVDYSGRAWSLDPPTRRMSSPKAWQRYHDMIHHTVLVAEIWGVMRHDALLRTKRFLRYFGSDRPMLAELALAGRFHLVPEPLFSLRLHPGNTTRQTWRTRGNGIDPTASALTMRFTGLQAYRDFGRAIWNADVGLADKMHCAVSWVSLLANRRVLHKLFVPGPHNYFGFHGPAKAPKAAKAEGQPVEKPTS